LAARTGGEGRREGTACIMRSDKEIYQRRRRRSSGGALIKGRRRKKKVKEGS